MFGIRRHLRLVCLGEKRVAIFKLKRCESGFETSVRSLICQISNFQFKIVLTSNYNFDMNFNFFLKILPEVNLALFDDNPAKETTKFVRIEKRDAHAVTSKYAIIINSTTICSTKKETSTSTTNKNGLSSERGW